MADNVDKLGLDASDFLAALTQVTSALKAHQVAVQVAAAQYAQFPQQSQQAVTGLNQIGTAATQAQQQVSRASQGMVLSFSQAIKVLEIQTIHRVFGGFIEGIQGAVVKAAELEVKISEIRTIAQQSAMGFDELASKIRAVSDASGKSQLDVTEAIYQGFSNQIIKTSADVDAFTGIITRFSRIAVTDLTVAGNVLASVMNSYHSTLAEGTQISNELFKTIEVGRLRASDLQNAGPTLNVAAQAGVARQEVFGLLSQLTIQGTSPAQALTQINALMQSLIKPSSEMKTLIQSWGFSSGQAAVQTLGFTNVLQRLFDEAQQGGGRLGELLPNVRALRAALGGTSGGGLGGLTNAIDQISNSSASANAAERIVQESPGDKFKKELNKIQNDLLDFGRQAVVGINNIFEPLGGLANALRQVSDPIRDLVLGAASVLSVATNLSTSLKSVGVDLGTLVKAFLAYKALNAALSFAETASSLVGLSSAATGAASAMNMQLLGTASAIPVTTSYSRVLTVLNSTLATTALVLGAAAIAYGAGNIIFKAATKNVDDLTDAFKRQSDALRKLNEDRAKANLDRDGTQTTTFQRTNQTNTSLLGGAIAVQRQRLNAYLESAKALTATSTEGVRVAFRAVSDEASRAVSDVQRRITEAQNTIEQSNRRQANFADRDASTSFQHQLGAVGRASTSFVQPIDTATDQGYQQFYQARIIAQSQLQQSQMQTGLITQRMAVLTQEANALSQSGDQADIQSARRKYEEIRRLAEQRFDIESNSSREQATARARLGEGGSDGVVRYTVDLQALQREMQRITALERAAEEQIRATAAERLRAAEQERVVVAARQTALTDAIKAQEAFRLTNGAGEIKTEFRGPQGRTAFNQQFDRLQGNVEDSMRAAGTSPEAFQAALRAMGQQRRDLENQLNRELAVIGSAGLETRLNNERDQRNRLQGSLLEDRRRAEEGAAAAQTRLPNSISRLVQDVNSESLTTRNGVSIPGIPGLQNIGGQSPAIRQARVQVEGFANLAGQAQTDLESARGTDREAAAMQRLRDTVEELGNAYREYNRLRGRTNLSQSSTGPEQLLESIQNSRGQVGQANNSLRQLDQNVENLRREFQGLPEDIQASALNLTTFGNAAGQQAEQIRSIVEQVRELNDQINQFNQNVPGAPNINPQGGGGGVSAEGEGFAAGGLIGGSFGQKGPDDRMSFVRTGEYVMNPDSTKRFYSQLVAMNSGQMPRSFSNGGLNGSSTTNVGDVTINVDGSHSPDETARKVYSALQRQYRRGNGRR